MIWGWYLSCIWRYVTYILQVIQFNYIFTYEANALLIHIWAIWYWFSTSTWSNATFFQQQKRTSSSDFIFDFWMDFKSWEVGIHHHSTGYFTIPNQVYSLWKFHSECWRAESWVGGSLERTNLPFSPDFINNCYFNVSKRFPVFISRLQNARRTRMFFTCGIWLFQCFNSYLHLQKLLQSRKTPYLS